MSESGIIVSIEPGAARGEWSERAYLEPGLRSEDLIVLFAVLMVPDLPECLLGGRLSFAHNPLTSLIELKLILSELTGASYTSNQSSSTSASTILLPLDETRDKPLLLFCLLAVDPACSHLLDCR